MQTVISLAEKAITGFEQYLVQPIGNLAGNYAEGKVSEKEPTGKVKTLLEKVERLSEYVMETKVAKISQFAPSFLGYIQAVALQNAKRVQETLGIKESFKYDHREEFGKKVAELVRLMPQPENKSSTDLLATPQKKIQLPKVEIVAKNTVEAVAKEIALSAPKQEVSTSKLAMNKVVTRLTSETAVNLATRTVVFYVGSYMLLSTIPSIRTAIVVGSIYAATYGHLLRAEALNSWFNSRAIPEEEKKLSEKEITFVLDRVKNSFFLNDRHEDVKTLKVRLNELRINPEDYQLDKKVPQPKTAPSPKAPSPKEPAKASEPESKMEKEQEVKEPSPQKPKEESDALFAERNAKTKGTEDYYKAGIKAFEFSVKNEINTEQSKVKLIEAKLGLYKVTDAPKKDWENLLREIESCSKSLNNASLRSHLLRFENQALKLKEKAPELIDENFGFDDDEVVEEQPLTTKRKLQFKNEAEQASAVIEMSESDDETNETNQ